MDRLRIEFEEECIVCDYAEFYTVYEAIYQFFLKSHSLLELYDLYFFQRLDDMEIPMVLDDFLYFLEQPVLIVRSTATQYNDLKEIYPCHSSIDIPPRSSSQSSESGDHYHMSGAIRRLATIVGAHSSAPLRTSKLVRAVTKLYNGLLSNRSQVFSVFSSNESYLYHAEPVYTYEHCCVWFYKTFYEYGRLTLVQKRVFADVEATPIYGGVPGSLGPSGLIFGEETVYQFVVGRSVQAGWVLAISIREHPKMALVLPICTKFYIVLFYNSALYIRLPEDFLQELYDGESDKEVQTFVLYIEGYYIVCNASISAMAQLHKMLSIAYYEVVGNFSQNTASERPYGRLASYRVQSCRLARKIASEKMDFERYFKDIDAEKFIKALVDLEDEAVEFVITYMVLEMLYTGDDSDLEKLIEQTTAFSSSLEINPEHYETPELESYKRIVDLIYQKLLQYPSHNRYASFNAVSDPILRFRGYMLAISCFYSDTVVPLPVELEQLQAEVIQEANLRDGAMYRFHINVCFISFDKDNNVLCEDDLVIPFKPITPCSDTNVDFSSREWGLFEYFVPFYLAGDDDHDEFPELYVSILKAFKFLQGDVGLTVNYVKTFRCIRQNYATYIVAALIPSASTMNTDYRTFLANIQASYGECEDFACIECYFSRARLASHHISGHKLMLISYKHPMMYEAQVLVASDTGLPFYCDIDEDLPDAQRTLEAAVGVDIYIPALPEFQLGDSEIRIAFPTSPIQVPNATFAPLTRVSAWLIRHLSEIYYYQLAQLFYDTAYPKLNICSADAYDFYDYYQDDEPDQDDSMSDPHNNVHPFLGPVDEFSDGNDELAEAIKGYIIRKTHQEAANQRIFDYGHQGISALLQFYVAAQFSDQGEASFCCRELDGELCRDMEAFLPFGNEKLLYINNKPTLIEELKIGYEIYFSDYYYAYSNGFLSDFIVKQPEIVVYHTAVVDEEAVNSDCAMISRIVRNMVNKTWANLYSGLRVPGSISSPTAELISTAEIDFLCHEPASLARIRESVHAWYNPVIWQLLERFRQLAETWQHVLAALYSASKVAIYMPLPVSPVRESNYQRIERIKREIGIEEQLARLLGE